MAEVNIPRSRQRMQTVLTTRCAPRPAGEVPRLAWMEFRAKANRSMMGALYTDLRKTNPTLPLFLDDRLTPYASPDHSWFGSWDVADRLTENPPFRVDSEVFAAARRESKTTVASWGGDQWRDRAGTPDDTPVYFASRLDIVAKANPAACLEWRRCRSILPAGRRCPSPAHRTASGQVEGPLC